VAALDTGHASDPKYAITARSQMIMTCSAELVNRRYEKPTIADIAYRAPWETYCITTLNRPPSPLLYYQKGLILLLPIHHFTRKGTL
jgi:hypothetical protein